MDDETTNDEGRRARISRQVSTWMCLRRRLKFRRDNVIMPEDAVFNIGYVRNIWHPFFVTFGLAMLIKIPGWKSWAKILYFTVFSSPSHPTLSPLSLFRTLMSERCSGSSISAILHFRAIHTRTAHVQRQRGTQGHTHMLSAIEDIGTNVFDIYTTHYSSVMYKAFIWSENPLGES